MSARYSFPAGSTPSAGGPNPLRPYYTGSDSPLQSYYNTSNTPALLDEDLAPAEFNSQAALKEYANNGLFKYGSLALNAPFEACQTLLQVQYLPNDDLINADEEELETARLEEEQRRIRDEALQRSREAEQNQRRLHEDEVWRARAQAERGYYDRTSNFPSSTGNYYSSQYDPLGSSTGSLNRDGYLDSRSRYDQDHQLQQRREHERSSTPSSLGSTLRTSVYDEATRPNYQLPPIEGGTWKAVMSLAKHPTEGWLSLWKGQYTNWIHEMLYIVSQPALEGTLNSVFDLYDDTIALVHLDHVGPNIATMVTSHLVVGFILSPFELVRTRLIVQTANPLQRKYSGMTNCFKTIIQEEGVSALWGGVNMFPTLVYYTLTPLFANLIPLIIDRVFKLTAADSPVLYSLAELGLNTVDLLLRLPVETVRKRLQIQVQNKGRPPVPGAKKYRTVVETRKRPYQGMVDCVYRIIKEEGGHHRRVAHTTRNSDGQVVATPAPERPWYSAWGVRGLYTGLGIQLAGNVGLFVVNAVSKIQDDGADL